MTATTILDGPAAVLASTGRNLGRSEWLEIDAERIALFARATGDPEAHYFALTLTNLFLPQIVEVRGFAMGVNYGTAHVVLPTALRAGDRVRGSAELVDVAERSGGLQTTMRITVEVDGRDEPACVVDAISRWIGEPSGEPES